MYEVVNVPRCFKFPHTEWGALYSLIATGVYLSSHVISGHDIFFSCDITQMITYKMYVIFQ